MPVAVIKATRISRLDSQWVIFPAPGRCKPQKDQVQEARRGFARVLSIHSRLIGALSTS